MLPDGLPTGVPTDWFSYQCQGGQAQGTHPVGGLRFFQDGTATFYYDTVIAYQAT